MFGLKAIIRAAFAVTALTFATAAVADGERIILAAAEPSYRDLSDRSLIQRRVSVRSGATGVARVASPGDALDRASAQRRSAGLRALRQDVRLREAAQAHANWMARNGVMAHVGAGGERFVQRVQRAGYAQFCFGAENVAYGQRSGAEVVAAWMASRPHRRAMMDPRAVHAAVAKATDANGQTYWTMVVAQPC